MNTILRRLSNSQIHPSSPSHPPSAQSPSTEPYKARSTPFSHSTTDQQANKEEQSDENVISALLSDNLQSPNAIPPRTSSTGVGINGFVPLQQSPRTPNGGQLHVPTKRASSSVLRPISETDWLSQGKRIDSEAVRRVSAGAEPRRKSSRQIMLGAGGDMNGGTNGKAIESPASVISSRGERALSDAYDNIANGSPKSRYAMAEPLPERTSSRHRMTPSMESKASSKNGTPQTVRTTHLPGGPAALDPLKQADDLIHQRNREWPAEKERILLGPYEYLLGHPGKDIRATLIHAFNQWLKVPDDSLRIITKVVGMLHTASLLVDDVEDSSQLRRGVPVAHAIFGTPQTINSANYVYFLALQHLTQLPDSTLPIRIYTEELLNLHRGQGLDLFWRDTLTCPTEAEYLEMVNDKTGGLFRLAVRLMQSQSQVEVDCVPLVNTIGLYFQVLDDYLNLVSSNYTRRKGLAEDLTEGKFSFPIIHAVRADETNLTLLSILKQRTHDDDVKRWAIGYMDRVGAFAHCKDVMEVLYRKAEEKVGEVERKVDAAEGGRGAGEASSSSNVNVGSGKRGADGVRGILRKMKVEYGDGMSGGK